MITSTVFKDKKILILGLGITGLNLYKAMIKSNAKVYTWDDCNNIKNNLKYHYILTKGYVNNGKSNQSCLLG